MHKRDKSFAETEHCVKLKMWEMCDDSYQYIVYFELFKIGIKVRCHSNGKSVCVVRMHDLIPLALDTIWEFLLSSYTYWYSINIQTRHWHTAHEDCAHAYIKMCLQFPFCTSFVRSLARSRGLKNLFSIFLVWWRRAIRAKRKHASEKHTERKMKEK